MREVVWLAYLFKIFFRDIVDMRLYSLTDISFDDAHDAFVQLAAGSSSCASSVTLYPGASTSASAGMIILSPTLSEK